MAAAETIREMGTAVRRIPVEELPEHLATLEAELAGGRAIELSRGDVVVAEVRAKNTLSEIEHRARPIPDFMGRMTEIFGDKVFPTGYMTQAVREDRDGDD